MTTVINYYSIPPDGHRRRAAVDLLDPYVYIGRPSKWGNPFVIGRDGNREEVVEKYRQFLDDNRQYESDAIVELKDKILVCWCKPLACHGDILAELADSV